VTGIVPLRHEEHAWPWEKRVDGSDPNAEVTIARDGFDYLAIDP
jgi:hypothetical protein